jgi:hypothetical protein
MVQGLAATPVSFEDFWIAWQSAPPGDLQPILAARSIDLWPDAQEAGGDDSDQTQATIGVDEIQHRSLYPVSDVDYVKFTAPAAGTYTVATSRCVGFPVVCDARVSNAADTILEVLGLPSGTAADNLNGVSYAQSCCPPNDATTLSSRVTFTATLGTPYVIQVKRSPDAPPSAGELGTYDLVVTQE